MTQANNPEIHVEQLMHKIREEVKRHHHLSPSPSLAAKSINISGEITIGGISCSYIETLLKDADFYSQTPTEFPKKLNRFPFNISKPLQKGFLKLYEFIFKKQRVVNSSLSQAMRATLAQNRQLIDQVNALQEQLHEMDQRLAATDDQVNAVNTHLVTDLSDRLIRAETGVRKNTERLTRTEIQSRDFEDYLTHIDIRVKTLSERLTQNEAEVSALSQSYIRNDSYIKNDLAQQKRLIVMFLEEARQRLPEPFSQEQIQNFTKEDPYGLEALYVAIEDQFRGSSESIINRLKVYLPLLEEVKVGTPDLPILDVGCGRGEWLELLQKEGYIAHGIDANRSMIDLCRAKGLEVVEGDVISYLQSLPNSGFGAVTGFHIIEHLPFEILIRLIDETVRVLKPGGLAIFETPNPQNLITSSHDFYYDPTHRNPLPSPLTKFLAESRGLCKIKVINLPHSSDTCKIQGEGSELETRFNEYFYGSQDYAIVGFKL